MPTLFNKFRASISTVQKIILPPPPSGGGPAIGDGLLLEAGTDFLLLETADFLILE